MTTQVTLTLDDETYRRAQHLAQLTGRTIADILADTIDISLQPLDVELVNSRSISQLSDKEVLELADSQMEFSQDRRLLSLLDKQQTGQLVDNERSELLALMQVYQDGLLRKAQALNEAVQRGIRKPLEP
jgi:hypothetical protein